MIGPQWEYCAVDMPLGGLRGPDRTAITFYTLNGANVVPLARDKVDPSGEQDQYRLIAMLGRDGWEMVGVSAGVFYFKRPTIMPEGKIVNPDRND